MRKCLKAIPLLLLTIAVMCSGRLMAQRINQGGTTIPVATSAGEVDNNAKPEQPKKAAAKKPRKPLESYFFDDSTRKRENFAWNVDMYGNNVKMVKIDTMLNRFEVDYPYLRKDVGSAYLGNLGGAAIPLNASERPNYKDFSFAQAYDVYFYTPQNVPFYNVKHPFSQFSYFMAGQKKYAEDYLDLVHAQNISPSTGFNLSYKSRGTKGIYTNQGSRAKNLSLAISHTGKKYSAHAGYIYNADLLHENGGVADDRFITDTVFPLPENVPVKLQDARNTLKQNTWYMVQSYGFPLKRLTDEDFSIAGGSSIFVGLSAQYSRFRKIYSDTKAGSGDFYDNWYINSTSTHDSIFESLFSGRAFMQIQPWKRESVVGVIDGGVGMDLHQYYYFSPADYLHGPGGTEVKQSSYYVYGSLRGQVGKYADWKGDVRFDPAGNRAGDINIGGRVAFHAYSKQRPITLSGSFRYSLTTPSYWQKNYFSNHFAWSNSFSKENESRLDVSLSIPYLRFEMGAYQSLLSNWIYYGPDALPVQASGTVSLSGLYASKDIRIGGLNLNNRVLLQWSSDSRVAPVPMASLFLSYYYEFNVVRGVLRLQTGVDGRYSSKYYAFGYQPATAQFYNQREKELGNYPMVDLFVAGKWKRLRILLKLEHLNDGMGSNNYFSVLHYPLNKRVLKLGISWGFYD